ncbi:MAG: hypothetical protein L0H55_15235 [Candidatus Nitrosocosmicus sp.]|nr:hypothetical protein [Candidatus Nitrosocosmicus sp.]
MTTIILLSGLIVPVFAEPFDTIIYLKDRNEGDWKQINYKVDYVTMEKSDNKHDKYEVVKDSNVSVTETDITTDYTLKTLNPDKLTAYSLYPMNEEFLITYVDGNTFEFKNINPLANVLYVVPPTFTETSPTTAIMNYTIDFSKMI